MDYTCVRVRKGEVEIEIGRERERKRAKKREREQRREKERDCVLSDEFVPLRMPKFEAIPSNAFATDDDNNDVEAADADDIGLDGKNFPRLQN